MDVLFVLLAAFVISYGTGIHGASFREKRGLNPFRTRVKCLTGQALWENKIDGCWCKEIDPPLLGPDGLPYSACCQKRKDCHDQRPECRRRRYTSVDDCTAGTIDCSVNTDSCAIHACKCDREGAMCFKNKPPCPPAPEKSDKVICFDINTDPNSYTIVFLKPDLIRVDKYSTIQLPKEKVLVFMIGTFQAIFTLKELSFTIKGAEKVTLIPKLVDQTPVDTIQLQAQNSLIKMNIADSGIKDIIGVDLKVDEDSTISNINMAVCVKIKFLLDLTPDEYDSLLEPAKEPVTFKVKLGPDGEPTKKPTGAGNEPPLPGIQQPPPPPPPEKLGPDGEPTEKPTGAGNEPPLPGIQQPPPPPPPENLVTKLPQPSTLAPAGGELVRKPDTFPSEGGILVQKPATVKPPIGGIHPPAPPGSFIFGFGHQKPGGVLTDFGRKKK